MDLVLSGSFLGAVHLLALVREQDKEIHAKELQAVNECV